MNTADIRAQLKAKRLNTPKEQQLALSERVTKQVCQQDFFKKSTHLALYIPVKGEVDPGLLLLEAQRTGKHCYLPVLSPYDHHPLCFMPLAPQTKLVKNRFNIEEPAFDESLLFPASLLDLVITPLVGFDARCNRIGMGAGFYDRTFAFLKESPRLAEPFLCGLAYEFQRVEDAEPQPWDVSLNAVVTESSIYKLHT